MELPSMTEVFLVWTVPYGHYQPHAATEHPEWDSCDWERKF